MTVRIHRLHRQQVVPADVPDVFAFFKNPNNLETITPPWLHFRIRGATDDAVREGTRITYRLRLGVVPLRWESLITEYRENEYFADEMLRGPYRRWYHRHQFRPVPGGVEIIDRVEYSFRAAPVGDLIRPLVVRQLAAIFDYRAARIAEQFGASRSRAASDSDGRGHHLVLFAHGSVATDWLTPFERTAAEVRAAVGHERVHLAFLERQSPDLVESIERAVSRGATEVSILPLFLAPGRHVERDLPELVGRARTSVGIPIQVLPIMGDDERLWRVVVDQAHEALGRPPTSTGRSESTGHPDRSTVQSLQRNRV